MATLSEILRDVPEGFVVLAGSAGLGREVARVVHLRPSDVAGASVGHGDLVVYAARNGHTDAARSPDHALTTLLTCGTAGVLTDVEPHSSEIQAAEKCGAPLLASIGGIETEQLHAHLVQTLAAHQSTLAQHQIELQRSMTDLARAGGTLAMLLERLVATTGKAGVLREESTGVEYVHQPVLQELDASILRHAIETSAPAVARWAATAVDGNLLYLELPGDRLVRLAAPVVVDGDVRALVSLFARPDELVARDRLALLAAAVALRTAFAGSVMDVASAVGRRRCGAVVLRAPEARAHELANAARLQFEHSDIALTDGVDDVRLCAAVEDVDRLEWTSRLHAWHTRLAADFGPVSIGHAQRMGAHASDVRYALAHATEAVFIGDRLFGVGHVTSYADALLASFFLGRRDTDELRALFEVVVGKLAAEDLERDGELVRTLEVYCETVSTQGTAARLQVHRNTVLYRLRQIEEITSYDLEDGPTRLLLQVGLQAGRLVRQTQPGRHGPPAQRFRAGRSADEIGAAEMLSKSAAG